MIKIRCDNTDEAHQLVKEIEEHLDAFETEGSVSRYKTEVVVAGLSNTHKTLDDLIVDQILDPTLDDYEVT